METENVVKVVCPQCRTGLSISVKNASDIGNKLIVCPKCQFRATIDVYRSGKAGTGGSGESGDTQPPGYISKNAMIVGQLRLVETGQLFPLKVGKNVIGRIAESGDADVKLCHDEYMSRRHVIIEVVKKSLGFEHRLVEINCKNPIKLNGDQIPRNEILVLEFGDKLLLGKTEVIFDKPKDAEDTLLR